MRLFGNAAGEDRPRKPDAAYDRKKADAAKRSSNASASGREIGPIPPVKDPARREAGRLDLRAALINYFPAKFALEFSADHDAFIAATERAILEGHKQARAMPRGSGKTTIFETAILWAALYAHCPFAVLIAATDDKAAGNLLAIATELETNDLLLEDFPEICFPIRALERINNRAKGQLQGGRPTRIELTKTKIVFPTVDGSVASGAVILAAGLTGSGVRGPKHTLADGRQIRPSVALIDDPQTRQSAASASQTRTREKIITADVTGMAGPGKPFSALCAVTVIYRGDLADRLLNRTINPDWRGTRCKLLNALPDNLELWEKYRELRAAELREEGDGSKANAFYIAHRSELDAGAEAAWEARKFPTDVSAIQHAMNIWCDSRDAFFSEFQNEPLEESGDTDELLDAAGIMTRLSRLPRGVAPIDADWLTAGIDVHDGLLYWTVAAWTREFRGAVIDYGTWPRQNRPYFTLREARPTLHTEYPDTTDEGAIGRGLADLVDHLAAKEWPREAGDDPLTLSRILIDEGYKAKVVAQLCRRSTHRRILRPSKGWAITAKTSDMADWKTRDGERVGQSWRDSAIEGAGIRRLTFDPNHWKTFVARRLAAPDGDPSALTLYGTDAKAHELFADHLVAEYRERTFGRGRWVNEWRPRPGKPDNHYLDTLIGSAVAASHLGAKLPDAVPLPAAPKRRRRAPRIKYHGRT